MSVFALCLPTEMDNQKLKRYFFLVKMLLFYLKNVYESKTFYVPLKVKKYKTRISVKILIDHFSMLSKPYVISTKACFNSAVR